MRAVIQRVTEASVSVAGSEVGRIKKGLLILLGVEKSDTEDDLHYLYEKIVNLRIFEDEASKMNLSLQEVSGELLVVSQFTLYGDCRKGRRPSFDDAAPAELAKSMYESFIELSRRSGYNVQTGKFQSHMSVQLINDGPVTILLDSKKKF